MDCDTAGYKEERFVEIRDEMKNMLTRVGWKKEFVENSVPILPMSGWVGDNLIKKSENMPWWSGLDITVGGEIIHVDTLFDVLDKMARPPVRDTSKPLRMPVSGLCSIKGVGNVITGRVEQGIVQPKQKVVFMPTHTGSVPCPGEVFTVEMHRKRVPQAEPGDNVGLNMKQLNKENMPRAGDVMICQNDTTLKHVETFTAQIQVLDIPGEIKIGYSPIGFVRCGRSACKITKLLWKIGKETGGKKAADPHCLKSNEIAEVEFQPCNPLIVDTFQSCEGLSRIAFLDGKGVVMLGKVVSVQHKDC